jgi:CO/xanthine dehydrogenase Mo-binding subunit
MTELRHCDLCEKPFVADEGWKRKCLICWKGESGYEKTKGDQAFAMMQDAYVELEEALEDVEVQLAAAEVQLSAARSSKKGAPVGKNQLTQERVKQLIKLAHPDRHGNNVLSTEVTKWLLSLREK